MTMTPEQAAKVIGKYTIFAVFPLKEVHALGDIPHIADGIRRDLAAGGIIPCQTCGAYRRADSCQVCDEAGKVVV